MEKLIIAAGIIITIIGIVLQFRASKKDNLADTNQEVQQNIQENEYQELDTRAELALNQDDWEQEEEVFEETKEEENNFETTNQEIPDLEANNSQELDSLIQMAVADGVVTANERKIIVEKARELGKDISEVELQVADALAQTDTEAETKLIDKNKEKGDLFEAYVVAKFDKKYFTLAEWAGDKYSQGNYAETTTQPDLKLRFAYKDVEQVFAVECKYRSNYYKGKVIWAKKHQIENYKKFEKEKQIPVFIALGVGGTANNPEELFIIPLKYASYPSLKKEYLMKFKKSKHHKNKFFFDAKKLKLS